MFGEAAIMDRRHPFSARQRSDVSPRSEVRIDLDGLSGQDEQSSAEKSPCVMKTFDVANPGINISEGDDSAVLLYTVLVWICEPRHQVQATCLCRTKNGVRLSFLPGQHQVMPWLEQMAMHAKTGQLIGLYRVEMRNEEFHWADMLVLKAEKPCLDNNKETSSKNESRDKEAVVDDSVAQETKENGYGDDVSYEELASRHKQLGNKDIQESRFQQAWMEYQKALWYLDCYDVKCAKSIGTQQSDQSRRSQISELRNTIPLNITWALFKLNNFRECISLCTQLLCSMTSSGTENQKEINKLLYRRAMSRVALLDYLSAIEDLSLIVNTTKTSDARNSSPFYINLADTIKEYQKHYEAKSKEVEEKYSFANKAPNMDLESYFL